MIKLTFLVTPSIYCVIECLQSRATTDHKPQGISRDLDSRPPRQQEYSVIYCNYIQTD